MNTRTGEEQALGPVRDVGVGLRACHFQHIIKHLPNVPWFEALVDNYLDDAGIGLVHLETIRQHYPIALHGVGLSVGSTDPLNINYLSKVKQLKNRFAPEIISDHLCWISHERSYWHELLPLPYTQEVVNHVADRISQVQDYLQTQFALENVSSYLSYRESEMTEWEFLNAIAEQADCHILLDINNIFVNSRNHCFDPYDYLQAINIKRVKQFHLAGFTDKGDYLLDSHGEPVHPPVWALYEKALARFGRVPTLIEWDSNIPDFPRLNQEAERAQAIMDRYE